MIRSGKILVIQNIDREGPGLFDQVLRENKVGFDVVLNEEDKSLPSVDEYAAVIMLGGPSSANDTDERTIRSVALVSKILDQNIPFLGICLGLQILVKAAGGSVVRCERSEVGWFSKEGRDFTVEITEAGKSDPLFEMMEPSIPVFQLHGETVVPTEEMLTLGTGESCRQQVVKVGPVAYGFQGHLELTLPMLERWAREDRELSHLDGADLFDRFARIEKRYTAGGHRLLENFIRLSLGC